jgi:ribosomal protein L12E/L44/L45/RPP1/RPP2
MSDTTDAPALEVPKPAAPAPPAESTDLPEWARKQISDANSEAANFRVQLKEEKRSSKELRDQLVALSAEQSNAASSQASVQSDFDKLVTAIKAEVPHEHIFAFAKTLQGGSEDELSAHAAELKTMFSVPPSRAVDRSQGQGSGPSQVKPADEFAKILQDQLNRR